MNLKADVEDWPEGLPRNYTDLFKEYGGYVTKYLTHRNKVSRNLEDLVQEVFTKLMEAKVLERFVDSVRKRQAEKEEEEIPAVMTTLEACSFLGVRYTYWCERLRSHLKKAKGSPVWFPDPIKGKDCAIGTIYLAEDIYFLGKLSKKRGNHLFNRSKIGTPPSKLSGKGFKSYLIRAADNHFKNWCRTRDRRYKELVLPPLEDGQLWESRLEAEMTVDDSSLLDIVLKLESGGVDVCTERGVVILSLMVDNRCSFTEAIQRYDRSQGGTVKTSPAVSPDHA